MLEILPNFDLEVGVNAEEYSGGKSNESSRGRAIALALLAVAAILAAVLLTASWPPVALSSTQYATKTCRTLPAYGTGINVECVMDGALWFAIPVDSSASTPQLIGWALTCGAAKVSNVFIQPKAGSTVVAANSSSPRGAERAAYLLMRYTKKVCTLDVSVEPITAFQGATATVAWGIDWPTKQDSISASSL